MQNQYSRTQLLLGADCLLYTSVRDPVPARSTAGINRYKGRNLNDIYRRDKNAEG